MRRCCRDAVGALVNQFADPLPVGRDEILHSERAVDDRVVERALGLGTELAVDQGGLGDNQRRGDQRPFVALEERPAGLVVGVVPIGGGHQRAGVDDEQSVAPESLCQRLVGLCRSTRRA